MAQRVRARITLLFSGLAARRAEAHVGSGATLKARGLPWHTTVTLFDAGTRALASQGGAAGVVVLASQGGAAGVAVVWDVVHGISGTPAQGRGALWAPLVRSDRLENGSGRVGVVETGCTLQRVRA